MTSFLIDPELRERNGAGGEPRPARPRFEPAPGILVQRRNGGTREPAESEPEPRRRPPRRIQDPAQLETPEATERRSARARRAAAAAASSSIGARKHSGLEIGEEFVPTALVEEILRRAREEGARGEPVVDRIVDPVVDRAVGGSGEVPLETAAAASDGAGAGFAPLGRTWSQLQEVARGERERPDPDVAKTAGAVLAGAASVAFALIRGF